jgi:hypothetical protein
VIVGAKHRDIEIAKAVRKILEDQHSSAIADKNIVHYIYDNRLLKILHQPNVRVVLTEKGREFLSRLEVA